MIGRSSTFGLNSAGATRTRSSSAACGLRAVADLEVAGRDFDWLASRVHVKQRKTALARRDLRVVAACGQRGAGFRRQAGCLAGSLDLACEHVGHERLGRRIRRVEHHEATRSEHVLQPSAERVCHSDTRLVTATKIVEERGRELGGRQHRLQLGEGGGDRLVQPHACHGTAVRARQVSHRDRSRRLLGVEDTTRLHFVPVVIFGVDPEHRDCRHADARRERVQRAGWRSAP